MSCAGACLVALQACSSDDRRAEVIARPASPTGTAPASSPPTDIPTSSKWLHAVPATVHIDRNVHEGRDGSVSKQDRRVHRASLLGVCGEGPLDLDAGATDRIGVEAPDYPGEARTLYVYADATQAAQRLAVVRNWLEACDAVEEWGTTELRSSDLGESSLLEVVTDVGTGAGPTGRWLRLIRVGNALLLTDSDDGEFAGPALERDIRRQEHDLAPVIRDLGVFVAP